jgi:hypothetical protein
MTKKLLFLLPVFLLVAFGCQKQKPTDASGDVLKLFKDPPAEFRSAPLWVWNDRITREQIEEQLRDFQARGIGGVFIHPRPGLITPYLSEEWLGLCRHAVDVGKSLGMKVWIYDENSYPSGFAGGHVPAQMPDAVRTGLRMTKASELPKSFESAPVVILRRTDSGFEDVTEKAGSESLGAGEYYIFDLVRQNPSPWYGGFTYVDLMRRDVTEKFLDVTLNAYKKAIGDEFGMTVPGVFQDEAEINPAGGREAVNWTPALFDKFKEKWGYDLRVHLPSLLEETGDWMRVRHNFYSTLLGLFIENWAIPYYDYCTQNKLAFTGHYWEHEWPHPRVSPDNLAMAAYAHMPGIDCLMNNWQTDPHAQFGNARAVKEIRSAANQMGRKRTMSETYGASGWDLTFIDQKRIGDWEYALGVNFLNQHLSYVTIKGARKRDHPLSFSYHEPWWSSYRLLADYFGRLSAVMSRGEQENRVLVIEPTATAWMYYSPLAESEKLRVVGDSFQNFIHALEARQVEYDLASEATLASRAAATGKKLRLGERDYDLVLLPPGLENLDKGTVELLQSFLAAGGKVLAWVEAPRFVEGQKSDAVSALAAQHLKNWLAAEPGRGVEQIYEICPPRLKFEDAARTSGLLFHHRRRLQDAEIVFLANVHSQEKVTGSFEASGRSCEKWDLFTGEVSAYPAEVQKGNLTVKFELPPAGSLLLCIRKNKQEKPEPQADPASFVWNELAPEKETIIRREAPNVLTIDYCDLLLGGKWEKDLYFYDAQRKTFERHGLERNPWDSAVQYKTNILDRDKFPADSGFEAAFWFTVLPGTDLSSLQAVVERPELFRVSVNGRGVEPLKDTWWLDRAFGVFDIGSHVVSGKNKITVKASPFTIHSELEPVYLLGDFGLQAREKGFALGPAAEMTFGTWDKQGLPLYSDKVSYKKTYKIDAVDPQAERCVVRLGSWSGAVAEVSVNGKLAGHIAFPPYDLDVTRMIAQGPNEISVTVCGTLKNTLGPHHNNLPLGSAWPGSFQRGAKEGYPPGGEYSTVGYGLLEDFKVLWGKKE